VKLNTRSIVEHLSELQIELLRAYAILLRERAVPLGLIAESDADRLWDRHVLDSLRGLACIGSADQSAFDTGSGAGLPGIPLAIALPAVRFTLIEPKRRRAAFLEAAAQTLGITNVSVRALRAEDVADETDLCLARALASPAESWRRASSLLSDRGRLLYWAGRTWGDHQVKGLERGGAKAEICLKPEFQWQGPLVIMGRFSPTSPKNNERA
jgi:16S rRNA (guanine527-N7)-methyltransferase